MMRFRRLTAIFLFAASGLAVLPLSKAEEGAPRYVVAIAPTVKGVTTPGATASLNDLLTSRLAADERWRLVERGQLERVENELALSAGGLTDAASAVRGGRMLKADIVLVCRMQAAGDAQGEALIEAVDASHAERLASGRVDLAERPNAVWLRAVPAGAVDSLASVITQVLGEATRKLAQFRGRPTIAPLFFGIPSWASGEQKVLRQTLIEELDRLAGQRKVRVLAPQVSEAVQGEGMLCSAGLVDFSPESWSQIADIFVWGHLLPGPPRPGPGGAWQGSTIYRLWIWNGSKDAEMIDFELKEGGASTVAREAVETVFGRLGRATAPEGEARKRVANLLMCEVRSFGVSDEDRLRLVDAAAFFAPDVREIQELQISRRLDALPYPADRTDVADSYIRLARTFWRLPDGSFDLGVINRAICSEWEADRAGLELLTEVGLALRGANPESFASVKAMIGGWMRRCGEAKNHDLARAAFEAWWPIARTVLADAKEDLVPGFPVVCDRPFKVLYVYTSDSSIRERGDRLRRPPSLSDNEPAVGRLIKLLTSKGPEIGDWALGAKDAIEVAPEPPSPPPVVPPHSVPFLSPPEPPREQRLYFELMNAIGRTDQAQTIRRLIDAGADPLWGSDQRRCPLIAAISAREWANLDAMLSNRLDRERLLQEGGAEPMLAGPLILWSALQCNRSDLALELLNAGVQLPTNRSYPGLFNLSPLGLALSNGNDEIIDRLLRAGARPEKPDLPLHWAVRQKAIVRLRQLLKLVEIPTSPHGWTLGCGIDDRSPDDLTPLWAAVIAGWTDGVRELIGAGAQVDVRDSRERRLEEDARPYPEIAVLINRRPGAADNQLAGAVAVAMVERDDPGLATLALDAAVLRYQDSRGGTVLHWACRRNREAFARRLVASGARLDAENIKSCQPLHMAASEGGPGLVAALIAAGAPLNHPSVDGMTPLHWAALAGDPASIRNLLAAGADQTCRASGGETPLQVAANSPRAFAAMQVFVEAGASLHEVDSLGLGLLERVVFSDDPEAIQFLIDHGVKWRRPWPAPAYSHPLLTALKDGKLRSVRKLLELGLYDDRALALVQGGETRTLLEDAARQHGSRVVDDAELWPGIAKDHAQGADRAKEHLARGGNTNFDGGRWSPLWLAVEERNVPLARLLVQSGADRNWYAPGLSSSPVLGDVISRAPWDDSEKQVFDGECAELVTIMVTRENAAAYRWILNSAVGKLLPRTVRALVAAGVPSAEEIEGIRKSSWLSEEEKQARLRLLNQ
ncbi:MAG: ankyrin repeat domain-containing protein [Opitutaceae bacterium]|nr:ankyrin repeat domain-containing protein [Opitutaceae bacterium]